MRVVALKRVVADAEVCPATDVREGTLELTDELQGAQRWNVASHLDRDVTGKAGGEDLPTAVTDERVRPGLAACSCPTAAPAGGECKLELRGLTH